MTVATLDQVNAAIADVATKLNTIPVGLLTDEGMRGIMKAHFDALMEDPDLARKMRFQDSSPSSLVGSKFARFGLGVADVEWLHDTVKAHHEFNPSKYKAPSESLGNAFRDISDALYIDEAEIKKIDRQAIDDMYPRVQKASMWNLDTAVKRMRDRQTAFKAMDSAESGYGSQLVGAQYVSDLWEVARRESRLFGLIRQFEMTAPTVYLPVEVDFPEMIYVGENTANNSSDYTTVKTGSQRVQVSAYKFLIHQMWSGEMEEDSLIPFVQFLRMQAAKSMAHYLDSLVLNGDTTNAATGNINLDDADPADTKHYLAFDGIRHGALVDNTANSTNANGPVTYELLRKQLGLMWDGTRFVDWGHPSDPNDLIHVADIDSADRIAELSEVLTMDKYGKDATVLNGEVVKIGRNPLVVSTAMGKTEADGKVSTTGSNNTLGQVASFNRNGFVTGMRRRVKVEVERLPGRDQTRLVYSLRMGFGRFTPTGAASGIESVAALYNINVT